MKLVGRQGLIAVAVLVGLAAPAAAADVTRERLPNGVTIVVRENPLAPVVAVSLLVRMGTRWENADNNGISSLVQTVMMEGTRKRGGAELADLIAGMGGKISAAGDVDYSVIRGSALARFWRDLLGLTAELALEPKLDAGDLDRSRDVVLSYIQRRRDSASARANDELYAALYAGHPYGFPVLGTAESLARVDHAALLAWYRRFYVGERLTLAVSGQVRADEVLAEARRLFGGVASGGPVTDPTRVPSPATMGKRVTVEQPAQQAQILMAALAPALDHADHAAVKVLATVLGGGMAGRLFAELRDKQALAYAATSYYDPVREAGALVLYLGTAPENVARAEDGLRREVERIRTQPVSPDELRRAKGYLLGTYAMDRRTNERQAWYLAFYDVEGVPPDYPERYRRAVEAVTGDDVLRVARTYLATPTTLVLRPK
ncbi:MAG: insulinase family protein [Candidatus Rokubacteria bacterium]|nr:insulinase family protein [Candidatus Rokubacteria bacterium]